MTTRNIWIASTYNCKIYKIDSTSGETIEILESPGQGMNATREHEAEKYQSTGDHGLEWKNGFLYVASHLLNIYMLWTQNHGLKLVVQKFLDTEFME